VQGAGGALMLPVSVAIVSAAFPADQRGRALGTMGGMAAVAGALGPTIGGVLTSALSWRAILLVNVPIAVACVYATLRSVPADEPRATRARVDVPGAALLGVGLVGLSVGLARPRTRAGGPRGCSSPWPRASWRLRPSWRASAGRATP
jgi:MFS family permease